MPLNFQPTIPAQSYYIKKKQRRSTKKEEIDHSLKRLTFLGPLDGGEAAVGGEVEQQRAVGGQLLEAARQEHLDLVVGRLVQQVLVGIVAPRGAVLGRIGPGPERHPAGRRRVVQVVRVVAGLALQRL